MAQEDSKVLSQSEIDALLAAFGDEPDEEGAATPARAELATSTLPRNTRLYDFRRPSKVSKEQLRTLTSIHEVVARMLSTAMTSQLRLAMQVTLSSVDQSNYEDYIRELGEHSVISVVSLEPLPGAIIWEVGEDSAFAMVDRLLGGVGQTLGQSRELTDIEVALLKSVVRNGLPSYRDAWVNIVDLDPTLEETYVGSQYVQIALATDTVMVAVFEVRLNETTGTMTMCIPYSVLEPIIGKLSTRALFASNRKDDAGRNMNAMISSLQEVKVPMVALLGGATLSFSDVLSLRTGDVVVLDSRINSQLPVIVVDRKKFTGIPQRTKKHYAIKVQEVVQDYEIPEDLQQLFDKAHELQAESMEAAND